MARIRDRALAAAHPWAQRMLFVLIDAEPLANH
jgi:hypothetical protein